MTVPSGEFAWPSSAKGFTRAMLPQNQSKNGRLAKRLGGYSADILNRPWDYAYFSTMCLPSRQTAGCPHPQPKKGNVRLLQPDIS
jgi:hypothetical protein